jgi:hypothetical protein
MCNLQRHHEQIEKKKLQKNYLSKIRVNRLAKQKMKRHYQEGTTKNDIELFVNMIMATFVGEDFTNVFNHCGYYFSGCVPDKEFGIWSSFI